MNAHGQHIQHQAAHNKGFDLDRALDSISAVLLHPMAHPWLLGAVAVGLLIYTILYAPVLPKASYGHIKGSTDAPSGGYDAYIIQIIFWSGVSVGLMWIFNEIGSNLNGFGSVLGA